MYFTILLLVISMFIMLMLTSYGIQYSGDVGISKSEEMVIGYKDTINETHLDLAYTQIPTAGKTKVAIVDNREDENMVFKEFCIYNKYLYKVFNYLPGMDEINGFDLIIFGNFDIEIEKLREYSLSGITMFFAELPDYSEIDSQPDLAHFFGIDVGVEEEIHTDGFKIYQDFMIGSERIYQKNDYFGKDDDTDIKVPYYSLLPGYEIYGVGILNNQIELGIKDEKLPPLLWKTRTDNSFIFVVNSDIFHESSLLGILTGFKTKEKDFHIYPIVNAQTISVINFPYLSNEREEEIRKTYGRSTQALVRDLLFPNITQVLKYYGESNNFFFAPKLNYDSKEFSNEDFDFFINEINKLSGDIGISFSQKSYVEMESILNANKFFFDENLPGYKFKNMYLGEFSKEELRKVLKKKFLSNIQLVMANYSKEEYLLSYIDEKTLSVNFNLNGFEHETIDDLRMISIENALGMCNMRVDLSKVFYPESSEEQWNSLSLDWSKGRTYFNDFKNFDFLSIDDLAERVRRFLSLDYIYTYDKDSLELSIDNFDEEAFFIISAYAKTIESSVNAEFEKVSKDTYLIKATNKDVSIQFKELGVLRTPRNNKLIPIKKNN